MRSLSPIRGRPVLLLASMLAAAGCTADVTSPAATADAAPAPDVATPELSSDLRAAMTTTLEAALSEIGMPPDVAMGTLQTFFLDVDARRRREVDPLDDRRTATP